MTAWVIGSRCSVRVPATSANLGPGFDSLGLALGVYDVVEIEVAADGLELSVTGEGEGDLPLDETHLVLRAFWTAVEHWGLDQPPGLKLLAHNAIPHGRGLGSSAAAVVAGVSAAARLAEPAVADLPHELLGLAGALEGHPDNAAAALLGGLTIAWCPQPGREPAGTPRAARLDPHPGLEPVVLVPDHRVETRHARSVLPDTVSHADAARGAGRAALLVHALTSDLSLLLPATEDWLHQGQRATAMPDTLAVVASLRGQGYAAVVSGAGPSVLVLCEGDPDGGPGERAARLAELAPPGWAVLLPGVAYQGTRSGRLSTGSGPEGK